MVGDEETVLSHKPIENEAKAPVVSAKSSRRRAAFGKRFCCCDVVVLVVVVVVVVVVSTTTYLGEDRDTKYLRFRRAFSFSGGAGGS